MTVRKKESGTGDTWLGRRCKICGNKLHGQQKSYCSEPCRKAAQARYHREYYQREKAAAKARKKTVVPQVRIKSFGRSFRTPEHEQFSHFCSKTGQLITADICRRRQQSVLGTGEIVDSFCRVTCRGSLLRPSTAAERKRHRREIARYEQQLRTNTVVAAQCAPT